MFTHSHSLDPMMLYKLQIIIRTSTKVNTDDNLDSEIQDEL